MGLNEKEDKNGGQEIVTPLSGLARLGLAVKEAGDRERERERVRAKINATAYNIESENCLVLPPLS